MSLPGFAVEIASFAFFSKPTCEPLEMRTIEAPAAPPPSPVDKGVGEIWVSCTVEEVRLTRLSQEPMIHTTQ
jgi:hypothetical protein